MDSLIRTIWGNGTGMRLHTAKNVYAITAIPQLLFQQLRYGGKTALTRPGGIQWKAVYRPVEEPDEVFEDIVMRTEPSTIEIPAPQKPPGWKLWIKSTVIITVAIGLLLILIGLMMYMASWMKKRVKQRRVR